MAFWLLLYSNCSKTQCPTTVFPSENNYSTHRDDPEIDTSAAKRTSRALIWAPFGSPDNSALDWSHFSSETHSPQTKTLRRPNCLLFSLILSQTNDKNETGVLGFQCRKNLDKTKNATMGERTLFLCVFKKFVN